MSRYIDTAKGVNTTTINEDLLFKTKNKTFIVFERRTVLQHIMAMVKVKIDIYFPMQICISL